jgi:lysophospholipase L1-like esterase
VAAASALGVIALAWASSWVGLQGVLATLVRRDLLSGSAALLGAALLWSGARALRAWGLSAPAGVRRGAWSVAGLVAAVALAARGASIQRSLEVPFGAAERPAGRFPFEPGRVLEEDRAGFRMVAHTEADGTRRCGAPAPPGASVVVLVGDSYVYGVGLPDEDTLCAHLAERLAASGPPVRVVNLGQPGASLHSYPATVAYAVETFHPDLLVLTLLPANDMRAYDVNDERDLRRHPLFAAAAAVWGLEDAWTAWSVSSEVLVPMPWGRWSIGWGLGGIAAASGGVPLVAEVFQFAEEPGFIYEAYRELFVQAADDGRASHGAEMELFEPRFWPRDARSPDGGAPLFIPGDGHPTGAGNAARAEHLAPQIRAALAVGRRR